MWRLDWMRGRGSTTEYLRLGRHAAERWQEVEGALNLVNRYALDVDATNPLPGLVDAMRVLFPTAPGTQMSLLLESAWLPLMLVDTGSSWLRTPELEALVRHRFGLQQSDPRDPISAWELRIEHRAGQRHALAYGLSPRVKQSLIEAGESAGVTWAAMQPAFSWGWQHLRPMRSWPQATGWWVWTEQDRLLTMRIAKGEFIGLNAGAALQNDEMDILGLIEGEAARLGVAPSRLSGDPVCAAIWGGSAEARGQAKGLTWLDIRGQGVKPVNPTVA